MFFIKLIRFFTGFVTFRAYGGFGERFINLCSGRNIPLWDVETDGNVIFACTTTDGYKRIIPCARSSGMKTKLVGKTGLPFLIYKLRFRRGLIAGMAFLVITLAFLSGRIWLIEVSGNVSVADEDIVAALNDEGIRIGAKRSAVNVPQSVLNAESRFPEVSRITVNISGSRAQVIVKENDAKPQMINNDGCYNVVSSADAQLVVLEAYSGTAQAKLFYPVLRGQTLISGINSNRDESVSYVHAHGYAVGRTEKRITDSFDRGTKVYKKKRVKKIYHLYFLGKTFSFGKPPAKYDYVFTSESYLAFGNKRMPVGLFYTEYSAAEKTDETLSIEELKMLCLEDYADRAESYVSSRQIIDISTQTTETRSAVTIEGKFVCYENIGREEPFEVTETREVQYDN